jgi:probable rRNA maturation factor
LKSRQTLNKLTQDCAKYTLKHLKLDKALKAAELSVLITDNKTIQKINKETRGKNYATNVLSFPFLDFNEGSFKFDNYLDSLFQGNDTEFELPVVSSSRKRGSQK